MAKAGGNMQINLDVFRLRLKNSLKEVVAALAQADDSAATVMLDQSSVGRLSRMDAMQQQAMAAGIRARLVSQKLKLDSALDRVNAGTYGLCCQCEAEIEIVRLEGDPAAVFCTDCSTQREIQGGRIGNV